ncbi:MAG: MopE-related protein [Myxococcota bacterium]
MTCISVTACDDAGSLGSSAVTPSGETAPAAIADGTEPSFGDCIPSCAFRTCGDDGCGGACGACADGESCVDFNCELGDDTGDDSSVEEPDLTPPTGTDEDDVDGTEPWEDPEEETDLPEDDGDDDDDDDGILDEMDNCPTISNPDQADLDGDYVGDDCDPDKDADGYLNELDCEPMNKLVSPGHQEQCGNGFDDNCNDEIDEEGALDCRDYFIDADNDGAGDPTTQRCLCVPDGDHAVKLSGDCDDSNPLISPLLLETCDDTDNNCNLLVDEGCDDDDDGYCDADLEIGSAGFPSTCANGGGDCYDYSGLVHPGATEIPGDGLDNDCDGEWAGEAGGSVEPNCSGVCTGTSIDAALCAMELCYGGYVGAAQIYSPTGHDTTGAYSALQHYGNANNDLMPFAGESYFIMASGMVDTGNHQDYLGGFGSAPDPFATDGYDMQDAVEFSVQLTAPPGVTGFSIDYIFMSVEYEEWIGSSFNDKFYIIMNGPGTTNGQDQVVNFTACSNPGVYHDFQNADGKWCYIAINTAFSEPCSNWTTDISGTGYECNIGEGSSTGWLTTTQSVQPGESFELRFHIHDTSDQIYDSAVILDNFQWQGGTVTSGTVTHK